MVRHHGKIQEEVEEGLEEEVERLDEENVETTTCTCMDGMKCDGVNKLYDSSTHGAHRAQWCAVTTSV